MWTYAQKSGTLSHDGSVIAEGYSGFKQGKNNPAMESVPDVGPIPKGRYAIADHCEEKGPLTMRLTPIEGTDTHGRAGFLIHGDSSEHPGEASHGCIILPRQARSLIAASPDKVLEVI